jgi:hypothetical protein
LIPGGTALFTFPRLTLRLFFFNTDCGEVLPRFAGMMMLVPGLYLYSSNPLYITLLVVVSIGVVLTATGYWLDRRNGSTPG